MFCINVFKKGKLNSSQYRYFIGNKSQKQNSVNIFRDLPLPLPKHFQINKLAFNFDRLQNPHPPYRTAQNTIRVRSASCAETCPPPLLSVEQTEHPTWSSKRDGTDRQSSSWPPPHCTTRTPICVWFRIYAACGSLSNLKCRTYWYLYLGNRWVN